MLGMRDEVERVLNNDPRNANATGAHEIPLLAHSVWSENLDLVQLVFGTGAKSGANLALHNSISRGNYEIVEWLIYNAGPDIRAKNYQVKSPFTLATELDNDRIVTLLKEHGATE